MLRPNPYRSLEQTLGHRFRKRRHLQTALTHPSALHEGADEGVDNNQRMEFFGDAVLGMLAAEWLTLNCPDLREGRMTQIRSDLTNGNTLAQVGRAWNISAHLILGRGEDNTGGRDRDSNLADAVEAILAAVYLDGGIRAVRKVFNRHFVAQITDLADRPTKTGNPKGQLQEFVQGKWKTNPVYRIEDETGPAHDRNYEAAVYLDDRKLATGIGSSKRTAEMQAAQLAYRFLLQESERDQDDSVTNPDEELT